MKLDYQKIGMPKENKIYPDDLIVVEYYNWGYKYTDHFTREAAVEELLDFGYPIDKNADICEVEEAIHEIYNY